VHCVARLADKYEMGGVLELCEQYLLATDPSVQTLVTAQNHHLNDLKNQCILRLSRDTTVSELGHDAHYNAITEVSLCLACC
jgi:hypothetical protein